MPTSRARAAALVVAPVLIFAGCGSPSARSTATTTTPTTSTTTTTAPPTTTTTTTAPATTTTTTTRPPVQLAAGFDWQPSPAAAALPVMWTATRSVHGADVAVALFDRRQVRLVLHPGGAIPPDSLGKVVAAFNGGFRFGGQSGMLLDGNQLGAVTDGMAAAAGYADGGFDVAQWGRDVPAAGRTAAWVRTNLELLVDGGQPSAAAANPGAWGAVLKSVGLRTARSAVGVTSDGHLVWAGGMHLLPDDLAATLIEAGAVRAMELDINPMWVALFSFETGQPVALVPGQIRPPSTYVAGWNRDFFTVELA